MSVHDLKYARQAVSLSASSLMLTDETGNNVSHAAIEFRVLPNGTMLITACGDGDSAAFVARIPEHIVGDLSYWLAMRRKT